MNCRECEDQIAAEASSLDLDEHVAACSQCAAYAEEIVRNRAALASMEIDPVSLARVRQRVFAAVRERRQARRWPWLAAAMAVAACGLFAIVLIPQNTPPLDPPKPVTFAIAAPPIVEAASVRPAKHVRHKPHLPVPAPEPHVDVDPGNQVAIRMLTDDPDVVIIWLADSKGDSL